MKVNNYSCSVKLLNNHINIYEFVTKLPPLLVVCTFFVLSVLG